MNNSSKTLLVGTGVVNLITAYFLAKQQRELILIDKAECPLGPSVWNHQGCTFGGENVRMFSYTEADNYNEKGSQLYSSMDEAFEHVIDDNGWLTRPKATLNDLEHDWINDFHNVDPEEAIQFGKDIYYVNIQSGQLWDQWLHEAPELFEQLDLLEGVFRIYSESEDFQAAQALHGSLGSLTDVLEMEDVLRDYPVFRSAYHQNMLGGCMKVKGFTLKVQDLCKKIIRFLMDYGAEFRWGTTFSGVERNHSGKVVGVWIDGSLEQYKNYVLSLGAYAGTTLRNTQTNNQIHGVLGVWLTLPNVYPELKNSMKIHKTGHVGEDTNVTLIKQDGREVLVLGSGYGYTGNATRNQIRNDELKGIFKSLKHTAQTYFPEAYEAARPYIDDTKKYCVRPWTPTGLGVFETIPALEGGQLIITGGNNTGGFTQAPYIADAVLHSLQKKIHPMHTLFSPLRMKKSQKI